MFLVIILTLIVLYILYTRYGVIGSDNQIGGGDNDSALNNSLKVVIGEKISNGDLVLPVSLYDINNKMLHQRDLTSAADLSAYIDNLKKTGRDVYIATLTSIDGDDEFAKWLTANQGKPDAIKKYQDILALIKSYGSIQCGEYIAYDSKHGMAVFKNTGVCQTFPKDYSDLVSIPKATGGNLDDILKELNQMQQSKKVDLDRAVQIAKDIQTKGEETSKQITTVRNTKMNIDDKLNVLQSAQNQSAQNQTAQVVLQSHQERLEKVENNLYSMGNDIQKAHAILTNIKDNMDANTTNSTDKSKLNKLSFELEKKPVCPVCPLYAASPGALISEVEVNGYGSIVRPGLEH